MYDRIRSASQVSSAVPAGPRLCRSHLGRLADLERRAVGQDAEPRLVLLARDRQQPLGDDRVAEPVGAGGADDERAALLVLDLQPDRALARLRVGRESSRLASRSATCPCPLDPLQDGDRQLLAGRLAQGVEGGGARR